MATPKQSFALVWTAMSMVFAVMSSPCAAGDEGDKQPRIVVKERTVGIGRLQEGEHGTVTFVIENEGTADLHIESVSASCGCTVPRNLTAAEKTIAPGASLELEALFNSQGRRGKQRKSVTVNSNDPLEPRLQLFLTAEVVTMFEILVDGRQIRRLSFGKLSQGKKVPQVIEVLPTDPNETLEIGSIELLNAALVFKTEPHTKDNRTGVLVKMSIDPTASLGQVSTSLVIDASVGGRTSASSVAIMGEVIGVLNYRPLTIKRMQPVLPGNSLPPLTITSNGMEPFEILSVDAGNHIEPKIEKRTLSHYQIELKIRETAPEGPFGAFLDVRTNLVDQPLVRVPIFASVLPRVTVEPPVVYLQSGDAETSLRTVKMEAASGETLEISEVTADQPFITAKIVDSPGRTSSAMKHISIEINGGAPSGMHTAYVRVRTNLDADPEAVIPVTVLVR